MTRYRINFGNCQVHYPGDLKACFRFIATDKADGPRPYIEFQDRDTGDWFRSKANNYVGKS
jgi:hypothetical protein